MTETFDQRYSEFGVVETVQANTRLLQQLLSQVADLNQMLCSGQASSFIPQASSFIPQGASFPAEFATGVVAGVADQHQECEAERLRLEDQIADLESQLFELNSQLDDLRQQNRDLATKVADKTVRKAISDTGAAQTMSWEDRKQLIIQQMEDDSFDAESFAGKMSYQCEDARETPELFVERLLRDLEARNQEIQELRHLLDQQAQAHKGQFAIGATAIAEMIDSDELVQQERNRLQSLQAEWEAKFREGEIEASLERAKLSRERQELAKRQAELEEELEHVRREQTQHDGSRPTSSRRWLVKLGLSDPQ